MLDSISVRRSKLEVKGPVALEVFKLCVFVCLVSSIFISTD